MAGLAKPTHLIYDEAVVQRTLLAESSLGDLRCPSVFRLMQLFKNEPTLGKHLQSSLVPSTPKFFEYRFKILRASTSLPVS